MTTTANAIVAAISFLSVLTCKSSLEDTYASYERATAAIVALDVVPADMAKYVADTVTSQLGNPNRKRELGSTIISKTVARSLAS